MAMLLSALLLLHTAAATDWNPPVPPVPGESYEVVGVAVQPPEEVAAAIGDMIEGEFQRHMPVLSDNIRSELSAMRSDIHRQFDNLKVHMDNKLDRMQGDAPATVADEDEQEGLSQLGKVSAGHTSSASIRHNLAMAELRRLGADLTRAMNREIANLRDEFLSSLDLLRNQVQNSTDNLAEQLQGEFSQKAEESTVMLKKVFFLTRSQMALIQNQLSNISKSLSVAPPEDETTPAPDTTTITDEETTPFPAQALNETDTTEQLQFSDCQEAKLVGGKTGPTTITTSKLPAVWCDQDTDGGGWTVVLRRREQDQQLDFKRTWQTYVNGFGDAEGEYWIGLEALHQLTGSEPYSLRVDMTWEDETATSLYDKFSVGPGGYGSTGYELNVGGYNVSSTGGDSLEYHNNQAFSTYDSDNDGASGGSCSDWSGGGGWWYNYCYYSNPTGIYPPKDLPVGTEVDHLLEWRKWQGYYTYLSSLTMMIRPNSKLSDS